MTLYLGGLRSGCHTDYKGQAQSLSGPSLDKTMLKNLPGAWRDTRGRCQSVSPPLFGSGDMGSLALSASTQLQATKPPHCHPDLVFQPQSVADTCVICHSYPEAGTKQISDLPLRGHSLRSVASIFGGRAFPGSPPPQDFCWETQAPWLRQCFLRTWVERQGQFQFFFSSLGLTTQGSTQTLYLGITPNLQCKKVGEDCSQQPLPASA